MRALLVFLAYLTLIPVAQARVQEYGVDGAMHSLAPYETVVYGPTRQCQLPGGPGVNQVCTIKSFGCWVSTFSSGQKISLSTKNFAPYENSDNDGIKELGVGAPTLYHFAGKTIYSAYGQGFSFTNIPSSMNGGTVTILCSY